MLNIINHWVQLLSRVRLCDPMSRSTPGLRVRRSPFSNQNYNEYSLTGLAAFINNKKQKQESGEIWENVHCWGECEIM